MHITPLSRRAILAAGSAAIMNQGCHTPRAPDMSTEKWLLLARRKPGMSFADFQSYYEGHHARLIYNLHGAPLSYYARRYLQSQAHLDTTPTGDHYDVMSELWANNTADMAAVMRRFDDPAIGQMFAADEENLFDRHSLRTYRVDEHETDLTTVSQAAAAFKQNPTGNVVKSILIARRRAGMSMPEFIDYYENHHAPLAVGELAGKPIVRYFRRYLEPLPQYDPYPGNDAHSVVMEMWYPNREDMDAIDRSFYESGKVDLYVEDEGRLFDRPSMKYYVAEERVSDLSRLRG